MKQRKWNRLLSVLLAVVTAVSLLAGCGGKSPEEEDAETITVYLWNIKFTLRLRRFFGYKCWRGENEAELINAFQLFLEFLVGIN